MFIVISLCTNSVLLIKETYDRAIWFYFETALKSSFIIPRFFISI
jgi:hypothetical protein